MPRKKSELWVDEFCKNNHDELMEIAELSSRSIRDKIAMDIGPDLCLAAYGTIFECILEVLKSKQKENSSFEINICNVISVSYDTLEDDDAEKMGNFMPFIQQIAEGQLPDSGLDVDESSTIELCTAWNSSHIKKQPDILTEISTMAVRELSEKLGVKSAAREIIMPIFCLVHEQIIAYIKLKRVDMGVSSYEIDVAGLYTVVVSETNDGKEIIEYPCSIYTKLTTKDDLHASDFE